MANRTIGPERRGLYYLGMALTGAGLLLFLSNVFFFAGDFGKVGDGPSLPKNDVPMEDPDWWDKSSAQHDKWWSDVESRHAEHGRQGQNMMFRALGGMGLIVLGGFLMKVGKSGLAGSGVVLDPQQARKDMEPWSRMKGGMVQDALEEVEVVKKLEGRIAPPP